MMLIIKLNVLTQFLYYYYLVIFFI